MAAGGPGLPGFVKWNGRSFCLVRTARIRLARVNRSPGGSESAPRYSAPWATCCFSGPKARPTQMDRRSAQPPGNECPRSLATRWSKPAGDVATWNPLDRRCLRSPLDRAWRRLGGNADAVASRNGRHARHRARMG